MRLREYLAVLRARWLIVVGCALLFTLASGALSLREPRVYEAKVSVFFSVSVGQTTSELSRGFAYAQGLVGSYAQVARQPVVLTPVIDRLGLDTTPQRLARSITAQAPLDTVIIDIVVRDGNAKQSADVANAVAQELSTTVARLVPKAQNNFSPVSVTIVSPATVPASPAAPRVPVNLAIGLIGGGVLGTVLAFLRDALDPRIGGGRDVLRITDSPVIGAIGREDRRGRVRRRVRRSSAERAKELRTNFQHLREENRLRSVVFTSAHEDTATALTVAGLGAELAAAGVRTVLVDGDLRKPTLSLRYTPQDAPGLSSVVLDVTPWRDVLVKHPELPLFVLPAGPLPYEPGLLLQHEAFSGLMADLAANFDVVLVKAPPVLRVAEGLLLARVADGVVVVGDEPAMRRDALAEEMEALEVADARVLGVVLVT